MLKKMKEKHDKKSITAFLRDRNYFKKSNKNLENTVTVIKNSL